MRVAGRQGRIFAPVSRPYVRTNRSRNRQLGLTPEAVSRPVAPTPGGEPSAIEEREWIEAMRLDDMIPDMPQLLLELGVKYDPDRLAAALTNRRGELAARTVKIVTTLGGFIASLASDKATGKLEANQQMRASQLRDILGGLGASFVKVGQALSSRPDLLPQIYLDTLASLQDQLESFPTGVAFAVIEEELGRPLEVMFSELTPLPVAAASLGQVYKARLRDTGELVAVKVQRPAIGESIAIDMLLLRRLMSLVDKNMPRISQPLTPLVDEFAGRLFSELDYVQEGKSAEKFQSLYGHLPNVGTPSIYWDFTARRVLTMEWIDGVKLTDKAGMAAAGLDIIDFVNIGIECTLRQLLEHGYFHADPHPGNLLATTEGVLVYLDFGMMSEAPQYARYAIIEHVVHLVNRDYLAMCEDYYTLQFMDRSVDTSPIAIPLAAFFDTVLDKSVSELNFKAIVDGLGGVLFDYPFRVPAYYALILRSLTVLEGLALTADPNYKLLAKAYPYMARRLLTDPAPQLRASFESLVLKDGELRWNRVENLLNEGSQSADFDVGGLWVLAEWLVSDSAEGVRKQFIAEIVQLVDASVAVDMHNRLAGRVGEGVARRLVPLQPLDTVRAKRADGVVAALQARLGGGVTLPTLEGTGPLGLPQPGEVQRFWQQLQSTWEATSPRVRSVLDQPGGKAMVDSLTSQLSQRFVARGVKLVFNDRTPQQGAAITGGSI